MDFTEKLEDLLTAFQEKAKRKIEARVHAKSPEFQEAYRVLTKDDGKQPSATSLKPGVVRCIEVVCKAQGKPDEDVTKQAIVAGMISRGYGPEDFEKKGRVRKYVASKLLGWMEKGLEKYLPPEDKADQVKYIRAARELMGEERAFEKATEEFHRDVLPDLKRILS